MGRAGGNMSDAKNTLEEAVLQVFKAACQQQDFEVAEHLLRALEVIADREVDGNCLEPAMLTLARSLLGTRHHS